MQPLQCYLLSLTGNIKSATEIMSHLQYIQNDSVPPASHPLSLLSSQSRDYWMDARVKLVEAGTETTLALLILVVDVALYFITS